MRDFVSPPLEFEMIFHENGYIKYKAPNSYYIENLDWKDLPEFKSRLSRASKKNFRKNIQQHSYKFYTLEVSDKSSIDIEHWYQLYLNVRHNNLSINTFDLPFKLFKSIASAKDWHILEMYPKKDFELKNYDQKCVSFVFIHACQTNVNPAIIGLDYAYQKDLRVYNCMLYEIVNWAKKNGYKKVNLGYTAGREKKKVGAKQQEAYGFTQIDDDFNMKMINEMAKER